MRSLPYRPTHRGTIPNSGYVEWDDTPSFADSLAQRLMYRSRPGRDSTTSATHQLETMPAELMPAAPVSTGFSEPVQGLSVREVMDADVFQHFFGER